MRPDLVDADQAIFQHLPLRLARINGLRERFVDILVAQIGQFLAVAAPEGFQDHAIGRFGAL